jgi:CheY-like chemotaxis protein
MSGQRVLIVDDDPSILRMVTLLLEKFGYVIDSARDGQAALALVARATPDLVITDVNMPRMDGWALVRELRSRPATSFTPVIFLTAQSGDDDRMLGFRLGADDYLAKPFNFEELKTKVRNILRRAAALESKTRAAEAVSSPTGLRGNLRDLGLASLLMLLEMEKKTGYLAVQGAVHARIAVRDGRLVGAEIPGWPRPRGVDLLLAVLAWADGTFEFVSAAVEGEDTVQVSTTHILLEAARLADEKKKA